MLKPFLNRVDAFILDGIKRIFRKIENNYKFNGLSVDIVQELKNFESNPLTCVVACDTKFETKIKLQLKIMIGLFFVAVPLSLLSLLTYILGLEYSYAFILTFIIALFVTSRLDEIAKRYVLSRLAIF